VGTFPDLNQSITDPNGNYLAPTNVFTGRMGGREEKRERGREERREGRKRQEDKINLEEDRQSKAKYKAKLNKKEISGCSADGSFSHACQNWTFAAFNAAGVGAYPDPSKWLSNGTISCTITAAIYCISTTATPMMWIVREFYLFFKSIFVICN